MTKIEELLKNEKVEWKKLGEVIDYEQPTKYIVNSTQYDDKFKTPVLTAGQTFILGYTNEIEGIYKASKEDPVIIFDDFTASNHWVDFEFKVKSSAMKILKPKNQFVNLRYCYHYIKTINFDVTEHKRIWISKYSQLEVPILSLEIQEKIVKILDKFTNYVTELQSELQSRTKQYNYYRDKLLSEQYLNKISEKIDKFEDKEYKLRVTTLGEIGEIKMCKRILKEQTSTKGTVPFYKIGTFGKKADSFISREIFEEYKKKYSYPKKGEVLISASGTIGRTVIFDGEDCYFQDSNIVWLSHNESKVLNKYLYYYYQIVNWNPSSGGTIKRMYNYNLVNMKIFLPPIEIQDKVVKVLDKFQELLKDTKGLLPQEIEQRQKQYKYYREKLLTFDEKCGNTHTHTHTIIPNNFFNLLKEASNIVGVELYNKAIISSFSQFALVTKLAGYEFTKYVKYSDEGKIIAIRGLNVKNGKLKLDDIKYIDNSDFSKLNRSKLKIGDIIFTYVGTIGEVGLIEEDDRYYLAPNVALIRINTNVALPKYIIYVLQSNEFKNSQINKWLEASSMKNLTMENIRKFKFLLPSLKVQEYIVSILDKFDTLVNDIKNGLPKEIELRQKQYEYYREKLLDFPKEN